MAYLKIKHFAIRFDHFSTPRTIHGIILLRHAMLFTIIYNFIVSLNQNQIGWFRKHYIFDNKSFKTNKVFCRIRIYKIKRDFKIVLQCLGFK